MTRNGAPDRALRLDVGQLSLSGARALPPAQREQQVQALAVRLDRPMSILGVIFLLVVLAEGLAEDPRLQTALTVTKLGVVGGVRR